MASGRFVFVCCVNIPEVITVIAGRNNSLLNYQLIKVFAKTSPSAHTGSDTNKIWCVYLPFPWGLTI